MKVNKYIYIYIHYPPFLGKNMVPISNSKGLFIIYARVAVRENYLDLYIKIL